MPAPPGTITTCCLGISVEPPFRAYAGCVDNHCRRLPDILPCSASVLTPGFNRPSTYSQLLSGTFKTEFLPSTVGSTDNGIHSAGGLLLIRSPKNPGGAIPTIVIGRPCR